MLYKLQPKECQLSECGIHTDLATYLFRHFSLFLQPFFLCCFVLLSRLYNMCQLFLHGREDCEDHHNSNVFFTLNKTSTVKELMLILRYIYSALYCYLLNRITAVYTARISWQKYKKITAFKAELSSN